ncbi:MAG: 4-hydroxy-tetrahydrodipicolinate reductase [Pseudomonadota bacterium]
MTAQLRTLGIIGGDGRMGQAVEAASDGRYDVQARITLDQTDYAALSACDCIIDFSAGPALLAALPHLNADTPIVSGTTGLSEAEDKTVAEASQTIPIFRSGNFSLGIAVLSSLARQAASALGEGWDIEILEMHHRHKLDAPSGTGLMLGEAVAEGRGVTLADVAAHDRVGKRKDGDIGFAVLRGGGVYGLHEVRLTSESEMITLGHQALNRNVFAHGALAAADWMIGKPPGLYSMSELIDL